MSSEVLRSFEQIAHTLRCLRIETPVNIYVPEPIFQSLQLAYKEKQRFPENSNNDTRSIIIYEILHVWDERVLKSIKVDKKQVRETFLDLMHDVVDVFKGYDFKGKL